jgi:proteic killer suppression protein
MIISFKCRNTEALWLYGTNKKLPPSIHKGALRKLWQLDNAESLRDLEAPPSNRLEALKRERLGQYSIRINEQWRVCFKWENIQVKDVEIVDYH